MHPRMRLTRMYRVTGVPWMRVSWMPWMSNLMWYEILIGSFCGDSIAHILHPRHNLIPHIQPQLPHLLLLDQRPMFPLPFSCSRSNPLPPGMLVRSQLIAVITIMRVIIIVVVVVMFVGATTSRIGGKVGGCGGGMGIIRYTCRSGHTRLRTSQGRHRHASGCRSQTGRLGLHLLA